jgi:Uncharacterized low-complexity proteins
VRPTSRRQPRPLKLQGVNLSGTILDRTNLEGADLTAAILETARIKRTDINKARLSREFENLDDDLRDILRDHNQWIESLGRIGVRADLSRYDLTEAGLEGAELSAALMSLSLLRQGNLNKANLAMADLSASNAPDVMAKSADLRGVSFAEANLRNAKFDRADCSPLYVQRPEGRLRYPASFANCNLTGASFCQADLRQADLSGAIMRKANLQDADLSHADLRGADFTGAMFDSINLTGAKMDGTIGIPSYLLDSTQN